MRNVIVKWLVRLFDWTCDCPICTDKRRKPHA